MHLVVGREEDVQRVARRTGHFMSADMVDSQLEALEPPRDAEIDVASVEATGEIAAVLDQVEDALATLPVGTSTAPLWSEGGDRREISIEGLRGLVKEIAATELIGVNAQRVLLVPPDATRLSSRVGRSRAPSTRR